jgi:hypothetical protein
VVRLWTEADRTHVTAPTEYEIRPSSTIVQVGSTGPAPALSDAELLARLGAMVDRAPTLSDLFAHRLGAIAAARWRASGRALPEPLLEEERFAAVTEFATPVLLNRILDVCDGPVMVLKGPEVAARYPEPRMRVHHDLDVLAEDSAAVQRALLAAGCKVGWDRGSEHHELPLVFPDLPLVIEVHRTAKWPAQTIAPPTAELFARAVPARACEGALALPPALHAVVVAAHAWTERPLRRALDLIDVQVLLRDGGREEATAAAAAWGIGAVWDATLTAGDALLGRRPLPWTLRTWARHVPHVREQRRLEAVLERVLAPFVALPPAAATGVAAAGLVHSLVPRRGRVPRHLRAALEHPALASEGKAPARASGLEERPPAATESPSD